jgi:hypothetical protein
MLPSKVDGEFQLLSQIHTIFPSKSSFEDTPLRFAISLIFKYIAPVMTFRQPTQYDADAKQVHKLSRLLSKRQKFS